MTSRFHQYLASRQPSPTLADAAIALGVPVFPCDAHKRPLPAHGFKDASADPAVIRRMFQNSAAVMIGAPTGAIVGWIVVDVDVKGGAQGAAWLDANSHRMVQTRTIRTGSGGLHLYFRWPGQPIRNSASKIAPGIDIRADGGYVIVPPSPGYAVADDAPIADLPDWLLPAILPPPAAEPALAPLLAPSQVIRDGGSPLGREALADRCDAIRTAWDGAKHATINESAFAIGGLVAAGHLIEGDAFAALRDALGAILPRCKDARAAEKTLARAFREGLGRPQDVAPPEEDRPLSPAVWNITQTMLARRKAPVPALAVPADLMDVPGALRLFVDHCERTAMSPQPFLALAAGICMIGALAGRRYRTSTDLRTNIYAIGVADSGGGKDHARRQILRCLYAAGLPQYLGGSDVASGAGLRTAMLRHPSMLFQIDEFGDWLSSVLGEKAAAHRKQIASMLKELYSSAAGPWQGAEYANQTKTADGRPREDIHQPNACLYGTTTPGQFWNAIAGANMEDGLLARMLLFVSPCSYPDERDPDLSEPSSDLIASLQAIAAGPGAAASGSGNLGALMLAATIPTPLTVPETTEAAAARRDLRRHQLAQQRKHEGTYVTAIAGRLAENAMKLALIRAVSRDPAAPTIHADDVAWGRALAQHCVDTLLREAAQNMADSDYERKVNRALSYIRKHGPISARALVKKGWVLPAKEREEILRTIVESGRAIAIEHPAGAEGGRPTIRYAVTTETGFAGADNDL